MMWYDCLYDIITLYVIALCSSTDLGITNNKEQTTNQKTTKKQVQIYNSQYQTMKKLCIPLKVKEKQK